MTELPTLQAGLADAAQRHYGARRRRSTPSWRLLSSGIALAAVAAVAIVVIVVSRAPDREVPASPPPAQRSGDGDRNPPFDRTFTSVPDAAQRFGATLRDAAPVPAGDASARGIRRAATKYGQDLDAFFVRRVTVGGSEVTLGVGDRVTCLQEMRRSGGGSVGCGPSATATDPDRPIVSWSEGGRVAGALIDGVSDVIVHRADGSQVAVQLHANLFSLQVDGKLAKLTYRKPDGSAGSIRLSEPVPAEDKLRDAAAP
jgi:hypothetical protein